MGNSQMQLNDQSQRRLKVATGTTVMLIAGILYYKWYHLSEKNKRQEQKIKFKLEPAEMATQTRQNKGHYSQEKIDKLSKDEDSRHKVVTNSKLGRSTIMKCIGRIIACKSEVKTPDENEIHGLASTGTVFAAWNGYFFVLTCAHSFINGFEQYKHLYFERMETFESKWKPPQVLKRYKSALKDDIKSFSVLKDGDKYAYLTIKVSVVEVNVNDLAVLVFQDSDCYYQNIFENDEKCDERAVHLMPVEKIPKHMVLTYNVYGYPCGSDEYAKTKGVQEGELWGMRSRSLTMVCKKDDEKECEIKKYVRTDNKKFAYNAIDTEGGQSGSAIYVCLPNGTYGIVGVHTNGYDTTNYGVALTENKIKELLSPWKFISN